MGRSPQSFDRSGSRLKQQPTVLVICEDLKSGKQYLEDARRHFRIDVRVEITHCGRTDPQGIVREARQRQARFDRVFCAIDRDDHQKFDEALALAQNSNITVIASYPCFEFWLLLHFGYCRKPYTAVGRDSAADRLISDLRRHPGMDKYSKGDAKSVFQMLRGASFNGARELAPRVLRDAIQSGEMNPSTNIHELIAFFEELSVPQPVGLVP